jgi:hypothetical protein
MMQIIFGTYAVPNLKPTRRETNISREMFVLGADWFMERHVIVAPCGVIGVFLRCLQHAIKTL